MLLLGTMYIHENTTVATFTAQDLHGPHMFILYKKLMKEKKNKAYDR